MPLLKSTKASPHCTQPAPPQPSTSSTTAGPVVSTTTNTTTTSSSPRAHKSVGHTMCAKKVPPTEVNVESASNVSEDAGRRRTGSGASRRRRVLARLQKMVGRGTHKKSKASGELSVPTTTTTTTTPATSPRGAQTGEKNVAHDSSSILTSTTTPVMATTTPTLSEAKEGSEKRQAQSQSLSHRPHLSVTLSTSTKTGLGGSSGQVPTLLPPLSAASNKTRESHNGTSLETNSKTGQWGGKEGASSNTTLPPLTATQVCSPTKSPRKEKQKGTGKRVSLPPLTTSRGATVQSPLTSQGRSHEGGSPHVKTASVQQESTVVSGPSGTVASDAAASTPQATTAIVTATSSYSRVDVKEYLRTNRVPQLFNRLSGDLLRDTPDDTVDYILQWLRAYRAQLT